MFSDENFDELKERLKKTDGGVVVKFYDSEVDSKNKVSSYHIIDKKCMHKNLTNFEIFQMKVKFYDLILDESKTVKISERSPRTVDYANS